MKKFKIVELFSGIGSQARALKNIGINIEVQATCEWDIHAFVAYDAIHNDEYILDSILQMPKEEIIKKLSEYSLSNDGKTSMSARSLKTYDDITLKRILSAITRTKNLVDINEVKGKEMPEFTDLLTYSFPCQDLSNVGAFHGYNKGIDIDSGSRSSLLWQVGRILEEMKQSKRTLPKYLIMENVPTLLSKRHFDNFNLWINKLNSIGYESKYIPVNAKNYGIPQNRPRLLMLSVYVGTDDLLREKIKSFFSNWEDDESYIVKEYKNSKYFKCLQIEDLLRVSHNKNSQLWQEEVECVPNDTPSRRKIWDLNPKIIDEDGNLTKDQFIRTITTKQDRNPNSGNIYIDTGIKGRAHFRYLTPRESLLFMGFTDEDYERLQKCNFKERKRGTLFPRDKILRLSGNSIPVKMLEGFFYQLYELEKIIRKHRGEPKIENNQRKY